MRPAHNRDDLDSISSVSTKIMRVWLNGIPDMENTMAKEKICKVCGDKELEPKRRYCRSCYLARATFLAKERYKKYGRYNYGKITCCICKKETTRWRKNQKACGVCYRAISTSDMQRVVNNYTYSGIDRYKDCIWEHKLIAEEKIGRKLAKNEVTHHIDEDPSNNAPENLLVLFRGVHTTLHQALRKKFVELISILGVDKARRIWPSFRLGTTNMFIRMRVCPNGKGN